MLLSIIVPVYNGEKKIERCLSSLAKIQESEIEFIIVNDGSTDGTKRICDDFTRNDDRFKIITQENGGVSRARNIGIKASIGKYIGFVDADDEVTEDFQKIIGKLDVVNYDLLTFCHYIKSQSDIKENCRFMLELGENENHLLYNNFLAGHSNCVWNNFYKSQIIKENDLMFREDMGMGEDALFNAAYLMYCKSNYHFTEIGYIYYIDNSQSASKLNKVSYLTDFIKIYEGYKMLYNACDPKLVKFDFYSAYYVDKIFYILKNNGRKVDKIIRQELKKSDLYKKIISDKYKSWRRKLRKLYIKINLFL